MNKAWAALLLLAFFFAFTAKAQDNPPALPAGGYELDIKFINSESSLPLKEQVIGLIFSRLGEDKRSVQLTNGNGYLQTYMDEGSWTLVAEINSVQTEGNDFFGTQKLNITKNANITVVMMPVGTLTGVVKDENLTVEGAKISLKCASAYYDMGTFYQYSKTDEFGAFTLKNVPTGSCHVYALAGHKSSAAKIHMEQGDLLSVAIEIKREGREDPVFNGLSISLFIFSAFIISYVIYRRYIMKPLIKKVRAHKNIGEKESPKSINKKNKKSGIKFTQKMNAILQTLNPNERKITEFIIESGGKSRQNKVYYSLLIPKVTLSRAIFSLENKNIITTRKLGKVKELELSDWFLK